MAARIYLNWKWFFGSLALVLSIGLITATASSDAATNAQTQAGGNCCSGMRQGWW
jgi:hypothetical protein